MNGIGGCAVALVATFLAAPQDDVANVPSEERVVGGDPAMRTFPHGGEKAPKKGYRLLVVLPGGSGAADFEPFGKRLWKNALSEEYLVAQLVAPRWSDEQARQNLPR